MTTPQTPLSGSPPVEVPLSEPPLVRVIAQVRFPVIASIEKREFIASFQEGIRNEYPVLRAEERRSVVLGPDVVRATRTTTAWRFLDAGSKWTITLAPDFLTLETERYSSRSDFLERLQHALLALEEHVAPKMMDWLGVRYIDRITGPILDDLSVLVRPEVSGILATPLECHVRYAISDHLFILPDNMGTVRARWGRVPAWSTVDPSSIPPMEAPSWLLDLDAFQEKTRPLDVSATVTQARCYAERLYSLFRWAVTDEFLRRYGGQP